MDPSSLSLRTQRPPGRLRECALSLLRDGGTGHAFREAMRRPASAVRDGLTQLCSSARCGWQSISWMLLACVPTFYLLVLALLENYYEHHRARDHRSRFADSVSYYGRWYASDVQRVAIKTCGNTSALDAVGSIARFRRSSGAQARSADATDPRILRLMGYASSVEPSAARSPKRSRRSVRRSLRRMRVASTCWRS